MEDRAGSQRSLGSAIFKMWLGSELLTSPIRQTQRPRKLRYSWAVDSGPFKLGRIARQLPVPQQPAGAVGALGTDVVRG